MNSRKDFFQTINNFPHSLAVYLTFTLDKEVIEKIAENSYGNIIILHDYRQGVSLKSNWNNRVVCIPINTYNQHQQNCFHSKLALLKGDERAKLLVGSANLSKDSFSKEKEICLETEIDFGSELYNSVVDYIQSLIPQTHTTTEIIQKAIGKLRFSTEKISAQSELSFTCNLLNASINDNICKQIIGERPILRICSPFLSSDFKKDLLNFIAKLNPKEVQFYLRRNYPLPDSFKLIQDIKLFQPKTVSTRNGFHAKIISIVYSKKEIVYVGSANFSRQGVFMNLEQGANQECGIIISSTNKNVLDDWFNEGWEKPLTINEWKEDSTSLEQTADIFPYQPYAWAEKTSDKVATVFFYISNKDWLNKVYVDDNKVNLSPKSSQLSIYQCEYRFRSEIIRIKIGNSYSEEISIFNEVAFEQRGKEIGESIFFEFSKIESVTPSILQEAIDKDGIKVQTLGAVVVEPPYLEQYFHNVKNRIAVLSKRKFFSDYHSEELTAVLKSISGGEGVYFAIQLHKCFEGKKQTQLCNICTKRITELLSENESLNISSKSLSNFYNKWKEY